MHTVEAKIEPTKFELLEDFKKVDAGHEFDPDKTNIKLIMTGSDWDRKKILIYGGKSTEQIIPYINQIQSRLSAIGHDMELHDQPEIANLAVSGSFSEKFDLSEISDHLQGSTDVEYEPEQFPGLFIYLSEPSCTFIIFGTGSYSIQGLSDPENISIALNDVANLLDLSIS